MTKKLFSHDPHTGITTWFEGDGKGGFQLHYESDVEGNLEHNKALMGTGWDGYVSKARELKHVAEVPLAVIHKWMCDEGVDALAPGNEDFMKRKLNDPNWRYLRVAPGTI